MQAWILQSGGVAVLKAGWASCCWGGETYYVSETALNLHRWFGERERERERQRETVAILAQESGAPTRKLLRGPSAGGEPRLSGGA